MVNKWLMRLVKLTNYLIVFNYVGDFSLEFQKVDQCVGGILADGKLINSYFINLANV